MDDEELKKHKAEFEKMFPPFDVEDILKTLGTPIEKKPFIPLPDLEMPNNMFSNCKIQNLNIYIKGEE